MVNYRPPDTFRVTLPGHRGTPFDVADEILLLFRSFVPIIQLQEMVEDKTGNIFP